jgi:hypothetical protein
MKKILVAASMACALNAFAGGYFENASLYTYTGWACEPTTPDFQGWIHFWRDDGKFLGALPANISREAAVGDNCGGNSSHGFFGNISFPQEYLDLQWHAVHAYFIRQDNTVFELTQSPQYVFFEDQRRTIPSSPGAATR